MKKEESAKKEEEKLEKNDGIKKEEKNIENDNDNQGKRSKEKNTGINEEDIKNKGIIDFTKITKKKEREIIPSEKVIERLTNVLLNGILMKFYLWFNKNSIFFKDMNLREKMYFELESFIGTIITRSYFKSRILDTLKMLNLSNFDEDELKILEDFFVEFKTGKRIKNDKK